MKHATMKWVSILIAGLALGPLAGQLVGRVRGTDGSPTGTALLSESPATGVAMSAAAILLAAVAGIIGGRLAGLRTALFSAGLVLAWGAFATARLDAVVRRTHDVSALWTLAAEGLILAGLGVAATLLILRVSKPELEARHHAKLLSTESLTAAAVTILVGAAGAMLIARTSKDVGQTLGAAVVAGIVGTLVGRVVAHRAPLGAFALAALFLAAIGPASGAIVNGTSIVEKVYAGNEFALTRVMPLDWIAGILLGVPVGASWASSMVEKHSHTPHAPHAPHAPHSAGAAR
jgi:hypothetical protein